MNRSKIEWCDFTWNPVTGCWHKCFYCYARKIAIRFAPKEFMGHDCTQPGNGLHEARYKGHPWRYGFEPTLHSYRLGEPARLPQPSKIFVCSMADLFGDWVPWEWIKAVQMAAEINQEHIFMFLTKNPKRYQEFNPWPENCWLGTTVTNQPEAEEKIPAILEAADAPMLFVSLEPMLGPVDFNKIPFPDKYFQQAGITGVLPDSSEADDYVWAQKNSAIKWIIIGAMTGPGAQKHRPQPEWLANVIGEARAAGLPVFVKDNLKWPGKMQEWPI